MGITIVRNIMIQLQPSRLCPVEYIGWDQLRFSLRERYGVEVNEMPDSILMDVIERWQADEADELRQSMKNDVKKEERYKSEWSDTEDDEEDDRVSTWSHEADWDWDMEVRPEFRCGTPPFFP